MGGAANAKDASLALQLYNYYIGVSLMMLVGFGYLMTFLRWYGLGALGLTMLITCVGIETSLISQAFLAAMTGGGASFEVDLMVLLQATFAVAAFLISFGALIGKVNPAQLVIMVVCETVFYTINKFMLEEHIQISDVGGTVVIHMFGAYFGLVIAQVLGAPVINLKEKASYVSDMFSLFGTVILWTYWPSFVAGATPAGTPDAELQIVQTILALSAASVTTFAMSPFMSDEGKIRPVDIQNATLAGGVSIGILAGTPITAAGSLLVGTAAGAISTFGFVHVSAYLEEKIGLHDTCGVHNLHGMPSVLGAVISVAIPYVFPEISEFVPMMQFRGIVLTLLLASVAGAITGFLMSKLADGTEMASDIHYWEVADDFDKVPDLDALDVYYMHKNIHSSVQVRGEPGAVREVAAVADKDSVKDDAAADIQGFATAFLREKRAAQEAAAAKEALAKKAAPESATKEATAAKQPAAAKEVAAKEAAAKEAAPKELAIGSVAPALPPPLPDGWRAAQSPEGKTYYYHTVTKQTTWSRPSDPAPTAPKGPSPGSQPDGWLPDGWEELQTLGGHAYWYHKESRSTAWKRPTAEFQRQMEEKAKAAAAKAQAAAKAAPDDVATALGDWVHALHAPAAPEPDADMAVEVAPLAAGWAELHTLGGRPYYYHEESRATAWTRPTAEEGPAKVVTTQAADGSVEPPLPAGWYELQTLGGRTYYYHKDQKRTVWTRPTASQNPAGDLGA